MPAGLRGSIGGVSSKLPNSLKGLQSGRHPPPRGSWWGATPTLLHSLRVSSRSRKKVSRFFAKVENN